MAKQKETVAVGVMRRPDVDVVDRGLQNPFGMPSTDVEFIEGGFVGRWVNTELKGGAQFRAALEAGYLQCPVEYLKHPEFVTHKKSVEGYVVRGEREKEVLMYTTIENLKKRTRKKQEENLRRMSDPNRSAADAVEAASRHIGDEAAEYLHQHSRPVGRVTDSYERVEQVPTTD